MRAEGGGPAGWPGRPGAGKSPGFYHRGLALLRTRLLGAVLMPALIGAAYSTARGAFRLLPFALILLGLAAAELLNLLASDYRVHRGGSPAGGNGPRLPGNPVFPPHLLDPARIPLLLLPIAGLGLAVLLIFTIMAGPGVLLLLAGAGLVGALYVFSPFPYAFLSTALIPPLISGGVDLALSGQADGAAFLAGLPVAWISVAVILGYRVMYGKTGRSYSSSRAVVAAVYALAAVNVAVFVWLGLYPAAALAALLPVLAFLVLFLRLSDRERSDPVPATAAGVFMHSSVCLLLAAALLLA